MLHLMKGMLNETNSSHTTRNHLARITHMENDINIEHKLNMDTMMNLIKFRVAFSLLLPKRFVELQL